jgi:hypothetical protein
LRTVSEPGSEPAAADRFDEDQDFCELRCCVPSITIAGAFQHRSRLQQIDRGAGVVSSEIPAIFANAERVKNRSSSSSGGI